MFRSRPLAVRCMHDPLPRVIGPYSALSCLIRPYRALLGLTDTQTEAHPMRFCLHPPVGAQSRNRTSDTRIFRGFRSPFGGGKPGEGDAFFSCPLEIPRR